jgi:hypothetical protein
MAINSMSQPPLRHIARLVASGNFTVPETATRLYASVNGSQGYNISGGPRGASGRGDGYVNVTPGGTAQIVIGAGGTTTTQGGITSFDGAITVAASGNGGQGRYGGVVQGSTGVITIVTSLPGGAPSGAAARVTGTTTGSSDLGSNGASGFVDIYG